MPRWFQEPMKFLVPELPWQATPVRDLPSWKDARAVSVDIETCDPKIRTHGIGVRRGAYIAGISFSIEDGPAHYLPMRHEGGGNLDPQDCLAYMRDQARCFTGTIVGANLSHDLDFLWEEKIVFEAAEKHRDVQIYEPLLDELQNRYSLDAIAERYDLAGKDEGLLREAAAAYGIKSNEVKKNLWRLPAAAVAPYAIQDAVLPHRIRRKQEARIEDAGLWEVANLEHDLMPCLLKMRRKGVRVDLEKVQQIASWATEVEGECFAKVRHLTGVWIKVGDSNKAAALAPAFEHQGIQLPVTPKTKKPSITKEIFEKYKGNEVVDTIRRAREFAKLRDTFCEQTLEMQCNGRIHSTINQLRKTTDDEDAADEDDEEASEGARYGRCSSKDPNMQQQPIRNKEYGKKWRSIYLADEGCFWVCGDFGQQEPRWLTDYAERAGLPGAREAADRYRNDPTTDNHTMMAEMTGLPRDQAKIIFLGLCYGMGGAKLCRKLGLPVEIWKAPSGKEVEVAGKEGRAILDQFNKRVPYIKLLAELAERVAKQRGYVRAGMRHCHFPRDAHGNYDWTYKALNRIVQGEAANQNKVAIVAAFRAGYDLQLTVHDELDYSETSMERAWALKDLMETCYPSNVPARVDLEIGENFGYIEKQAA